MSTEISSSNDEVNVNTNNQLSKSQQKRLERYQSLGNKSKAKSDKEKFDARYASLYSKSFSRRKKLTQLSLYEQFCEILTIRSSKTLNPQNFLDFLASLIAVYIGKNQTISIVKQTSNYSIDHQILCVTNIERLIPYFAPRDKVTFILPETLQTTNNDDDDNDGDNEKKQNDDDNNNYPDGIDDDNVPNNIDENEEKKAIEDDANNKNNKIVVQTINASYAFGAMPDQRLLSDNQCSPYIMDEHYQWTILHGVKIKPNRTDRSVATEKIVAAAIISDGNTNTYCVYGTREGLYYNDNKLKKNKKGTNNAVKLLNKCVDGIFRQNDYLFVLCNSYLYNVSLTKDGSINVEVIFHTKKIYKLFGLHSFFIGAYYDNENNMLYVATNNAQIYAFHNGGLLDVKFNDKYGEYRREQLRYDLVVKKLEKGNVMYYDVDRNCLIYIGTKYVMKISLDRATNGGYKSGSEFAKIYDMKWFLKGIGYDCNYFLYIYHQKTLVVLKRVSSSANCPYVLKIYTGKCLRFR